MKIDEQKKAATAKYMREWRAAHPKTDAQKAERIIYMREYRANNPDAVSRCRDRAREYARKRRATPEGKAKAAQNMREWRTANPEAAKRISQKWRKANPEKMKALRAREDRLSHGLRNRMNQAIKNGQKAGSAVRDLGCSIEHLRGYLAGQFETGMSWDNWSRDGWHIDHIKPLSSFDLTDPKQFRQAAHYTNLQPLWATENLRKGAR